MTTPDVGRGPAAWAVEEQRWYADMVVHSTAPKQHRRANDTSTILEQLEAMPVNQCVLMRGKAALDGRFKDRAGLVWSHDRHGRWFANLNGKVVWLGRQLASLRSGHAHVPGALKASHNCGSKGCIRWQHVRYQSRREDVLDREYHALHTSGLRPEVRALLEPPAELITIQQPARFRSPVISHDLPQPQFTSPDLP